jgi:hypothetical protein
MFLHNTRDPDPSATIADRRCAPSGIPSPDDPDGVGSPQVRLLALGPHGCAVDCLTRTVDQLRH